MPIDSMCTTRMNIKPPRVTRIESIIDEMFLPFVHIKVTTASGKKPFLVTCSSPLEKVHAER